MFDFVVRKLLVEQPIDQMLLDLLDWLLDHEVFVLNQVLLTWNQYNVVKIEKKYKKTHHQNRSSFGWMDSSIGALVSYRVLNVSLLKISINDIQWWIWMRFHLPISSGFLRLPKQAVFGFMFRSKDKDWHQSSTDGEFKWWENLHLELKKFTHKNIETHNVLCF